MKKIILNFFYLYKREPIIMFMLSCLLLIGSNLSIYATLLLVPYIITRKTKVHNDNLFVYVIMYSITYSLFSFFNGYYDEAIGNLIFQLLFPPTFYLIGKCIAVSYSPQKIELFLLLIISYIALPVIKTVFYDIQTNQFINLSRCIVLEDGTEAGSATILGLQVSLATSSIGILFGKLKDNYEKILSCLFLLLSIGGIICILHLVNRTGLIIVAASILIVFLLNIRFLPKKNILIMTMCVMILIVFYIPQMVFLTEINDAYISRNDVIGGEVSSAGGRSDLWLYGLNSLINYPLGIPKIERTHFSHNYWLDTNINGGIFAFLSLLVISIKHLKNSFQIIKNSEAGVLRSLFISINIGFFFTALVEPIFEGFQIYVFILFMFIGIVQEYRISRIY